jgi:hypothetical protein
MAPGAGIARLAEGSSVPALSNALQRLAIERSEALWPEFSFA